jgi:hypothetical protein
MSNYDYHFWLETGGTPRSFPCEACGIETPHVPIGGGVMKCMNARKEGQACGKLQKACSDAEE